MFPNFMPLSTDGRFGDKDLNARKEVQGKFRLAQGVFFIVYNCLLRL